MLPSSPVTPEILAAALKQAGVEASEGIDLEWRTWRWVGQADRDCIVFVPPSEEAAKRLATEADLLDLISKRTRLDLPQLIYHDPKTGLQVRRKVPGVQIPSGEEPAFGGTSQGLTLAKELGESIADFHSCITLEEGLAIGLSSVEPCCFSPDAIDALQTEVGNADQVEALQKLMSIHRNEPPSKSDVVVVHGDVWRGNMAIDPKSGGLIGLFDFDDCGLADRHFDLRYTHSFGDDFAACCFAAYSAKSGAAISIRRTAMYHAISAFEALHEAILGGDAENIRRRRAWVGQACRGSIGRHLSIGK
jgi:aminoglycoside phosphotransferase